MDDLMQETEGRLFRFRRNVKKDVIQINPVIKEAMKIIQLAANRKTGWQYSNRIPSAGQDDHGLAELRSYYHCSRPAMGKTAFVLSMAKILPSIFNSLSVSSRSKCPTFSW